MADAVRVMWHGVGKRRKAKTAPAYARRGAVRSEELVGIVDVLRPDGSKSCCKVWRPELGDRPDPTHLPARASGVEIVEQFGIRTRQLGWLIAIKREVRRQEDEEKAVETARQFGRALREEK